MSQRVTFPVTITGKNVTETNVKLPTGKGPFDKVGITIQQTNVIDENGQNLVIPAGSWLNGICPPTKMDDVVAGHTIPVSISAKPKNDGTFWYNFAFFPSEPAPTPAPVVAPAPITQPTPAPASDTVGRAEFQAAIDNLQSQITAVANEISF